MAATVGMGRAARRFITDWPSSINSRTFSGEAFSVIIFRSTPAIKIERLALMRITPLSCGALAMKSISSPSSVSVRWSKILAAEPGRSNVSTQIWSARIERWIVRCGPDSIAAAPRPDPFPAARSVERDEGESTFAVEARDCKVSIIAGSIPFQPQGGALATADAQGDQRAFGFATLQFFQA